MKNIAIIGSGSFGCALAYILSKKNNVKIWSFTEEEKDYINKNHSCMFLKNLKLPENVKCYKSYEETIKDSDYIILVTPSNVIRTTANSIKNYITNQKIVVASKGMENDKVLSQVVFEELNIDPIVISGPSHAEQIIKGIPTFIEYSGEIEKDIFETDTFKLINNNDKIGIQLGAALKNVISLGEGLVKGLGYESNTISYFITEGLREIKEIGIQLGAKETTFYGLSGLGDLLTTSLSLDSRNKKAGVLLSTGKSLEEVQKEIGMTIEGIDALKFAKEIIKKYNIKCPLIEKLYDIIYNNKNINSII